MATIIVKTQAAAKTATDALKTSDERYLCLSQDSKLFTDKLDSKPEVVVWEITSKKTGKRAAVYFYPKEGDKPQGFINADLLEV